MNPSSAPFVFLGGHTVLDFANTLYLQRNGAVETLQHIKDVLRWMTEAGIMSDARRSELNRIWSSSSESEVVLRKVQKFRSLCFEVLGCIVKNIPIPKTAIEEINHILSTGGVTVRLVESPDGLKKQTVYALQSPEHFIVPLANLLSDLLVSGDRTRIKQCANPKCRLFFYDTGKNKTRRWCSMKTCGNRRKSTGVYAKKRDSI